MKIFGENFGMSWNQCAKDIYGNTEECDLCGEFVGLQNIELTLSGQWLCRKCRENKNPRQRGGGSHETQAACGAAGAT